MIFYNNCSMNAHGTLPFQMESFTAWSPELISGYAFQASSRSSLRLAKLFFHRRCLSILFCIPVASLMNLSWIPPTVGLQRQLLLALSSHDSFIRSSVSHQPEPLLLSILQAAFNSSTRLGLLPIFIIFTHHIYIAPYSLPISIGSDLGVILFGAVLWMHTLADG